MRRARILSVCLSIAVWALSAGTAKAVNYDEGVDGDLSGDRFNPTNLVLGMGVNNVTATSSNPGTPDREYLHYTLTSGLFLSQVNLLSYSGGDPTAFIGVQNGATFTEPPNGTVVGNLRGYTHFGPAGGPNNVGTDILDDMGTGAGSQMFTPPLPSGHYTFWMQQTGGAGPSTYSMDFVVTPEPGGLSLLAIAGFALVTKRRK